MYRKISKLSLMLLVVFLFTSLGSQEFKKPQAPNVQKYKSVCKRLISTKANYGFFIDEIAGISGMQEEDKKKKGVIYLPQPFSVSAFLGKKAEIEDWNERMGDKKRSFEKNAQYYINRYEQLTTVFDIKVILKGIKTNTDKNVKSHSDLNTCYCEFEVTFTPKEELDIGIISSDGSIKGARQILPSVMELSDKDFNILSNLFGRSLAEQRFLDNEAVSYLVDKYYVREYLLGGYRYSKRAWGKNVELSISVDLLERITKDPSIIDLPM